MDTPITTVQDLVNLLLKYAPDRKIDFVSNRRLGNVIDQWVVDDYLADYDDKMVPHTLVLNIYGRS